MAVNIGYNSISMFKNQNFEATLHAPHRTKMQEKIFNWHYLQHSDHPIVCDGAFVPVHSPSVSATVCMPHRNCSHHPWWSKFHPSRSKCAHFRRNRSNLFWWLSTADRVLWSNMWLRSQNPLKCRVLGIQNDHRSSVPYLGLCHATHLCIISI